MQHLTALQRKSAAAIWQGAVKRASRLAELLARVVPLTVGSTSTGWVTASKRFATFAVAMSRKQGQRGLAIYLKAANLNLLRAVSGKRLLNSRDSGCAVSVSAGGLPRLIPPAHRARIRGGDKAVLRFWLCLFTLYRVLDFRGKYSLKTIVNPGVVIPSGLMRSWNDFLNGKFTEYLEKEGVASFFSPVEYLDEPPTGTGDALGSVGSQAFGRDVNKGSGETVLSLGVRRAVITKSGPNSKSGSVSVANVIEDASAWLSRPELFHKLRRFAELTGCPYIDGGPPWIAGSENVIRVNNVRDEIRSGKRKNPFGERAPVPDGPMGSLGKLGVREEPGKMRLFAMVDCWTQWVMNPLHVALFAVLKIIPQDGTFNQGKPVEELVKRLKTKGHKSVWSYDLSAATDRLPVVLQEKLLAIFTSEEYAELWRSILCDRTYEVPGDLKKTFGAKHLWSLLGREPNPYEPLSVKYSVGQPMGALSSWAMLAITHHAIVQFAAWRAGWRVWFPDYAVLGDDVVIANGDVAHQYVRFMKEVGVDIGFHKSIISDNLSLEFAKRFYWQGEEVTPFPLLGAAVGWLGSDFVPEVIRACEALTGSRTTTFQIARYLKYGMRVASKAGNARLRTLPRRMLSVLILILHPGSIRGVDDLCRWWRAKSFSSSFPSTVLDRSNVISHLLSYVNETVITSIEERMFRILSEFKLNLNLPFPPEGELKSECEQWWQWVLAEDLLQAFERSLDSIREMAWGIEQSEEPSESEVTKLLEAIEQIEVESTAIPMTVKSIKPKPEKAAVRERKPKKVRTWRKLHEFLSGARSSGGARPRLSGGNATSGAGLDSF